MSNFFGNSSVESPEEKWTNWLNELNYQRLNDNWMHHRTNNSHSDGKFRPNIHVRQTQAHTRHTHTHIYVIDRWQCHATHTTRQIHQNLVFWKWWKWDKIHQCAEPAKCTRQSFQLKQIAKINNELAEYFSIIFIVFNSNGTRWTNDRWKP